MFPLEAPMAPGDRSSVRIPDLHIPSANSCPSGIMDEVLKSRKMGSASARRRKFQDRQAQQAMEVQRRQEQKRRILIYDHVAEHLEGRDDSSSDDDEAQYDRESSVETPSERSVLTPDQSLISIATLPK